MSDATQPIGPAPDDPDAYVRNNRDRLVRVIRHGIDLFTRCPPTAALIEYSPDPSSEQVIEDIHHMEESA